MFGAPSGGYSSFLESALESAGGNLATVMANLANLDAFKSQYAGSHDAIATKMAAVYGFSSVSGGVGQTVKDFITGQLDGGVSISGLFGVINDYLIGTSNPIFADAKALLLNKINVANFYTYDMQGGSLDIPTLQQVITSVGVSASTVVSANVQIATTLNNTAVFNPTVATLTAGNDTYVGTNGNDNADGSSGTDAMDGSDGNDRLVGGVGNDTLLGGKGLDLLIGGSGDDRLEAGSYGNYTGGWNGSTYVYTGTFDAHSEVLQGGDGADTLYGGYGSDILDGGGGADNIYGDYSANYASYATADQKLAMFNDTILGGDGADTIYGGEGVDWIDAGPGADIATLGSGGGFLDGGEGNDRLNTSNGDDRIFGGAGDDIIGSYGYGSNGGSDTIDCGDGNDSVTLYKYSTTGGDDSVVGGNGNDTISFDKTLGSLTLDGGAGDDTISVSGGSSNATISAGDGVDVIRLGKGTYTIDLTESASSKDTLDVNSVSQNDPTSISKAIGFNVAVDAIDVGRFDLWNTSYGYAYAGANESYSTLYSVYTQKIASPSTPLQGPTGTSQSTYANGKTTYNTDFQGKGIFVISGASAAAADTTTVAEFLNPYGNNATYAVGESHYFALDIVGQGAALYKFKDDTNGDNNIVADELTPMVLLTGVSADSLTYANFI